MTVHFVTRHAGAKEWAVRRGIEVDQVVEHLEPASLQPGDTVIGALPVGLVEQICRQGCRYLHLDMNVPWEWRGQELDADTMERFGATLRSYRVEPNDL